MIAQPQHEHQWLQRLVGDWTFESEAPMDPDQPAVKSVGTEHVRSLGDLWILAEGQGEMPGGGAVTTLMTLGYDPKKGQYTGTWIGSIMTHLWTYAGVLDASRSVLTLDTEGPHMAEEGKLARYRDVIEVKSNDQRVLRSLMLGDDGAWREIMVAHYHRKS